MTKKLERDLAQSSVEKSHAEIDVQSQRIEIDEFRADLLKQTKQYGEAKREIDSLQQTRAELSKKEQRLLEELNKLEGTMEEQEKIADVVGFRDVNAELEQTSKDTMSINELKTQTLTDMSSTVQKIVLLLESRQEELEPKIQLLKKTRAQYQDLQEHYNSKKTSHDEMKNKKKADNEYLEQESAKLREELAEKEKEYHELCSSKDNIESNIICCTSESISDLNAKLSDQELVLNDIRQKYNTRKDGMVYKAKQRDLFSSLLSLLELKRQNIDDQPGAVLGSVSKV